MASVNKIILIGTVTAVPDSRVLAGRSMVVSLRLETKTENDSETHDVTFYGRLGEIVMEYVRQGSMIFVEGKIRSRLYEDKKGIKRQVTDIVAQKMLMLDRKKEDVDQLEDLFPADNPYKKAREGASQLPDLSRFDYDDW